MDKNDAAQLMDHLVALTPSIDGILMLVDHMADVEERRVYRERVTKLMTDIYLDLMVPIIRKFPELDPDQES